MKKIESASPLPAEMQPTQVSAVAPGEVVIGTLVGVDGQGQPLVDFAQNDSGCPLAAMSTVGITAAQAGRKVAVLFAKGDSQCPVIIGVIHDPLQELLAAYDAKTAKGPSTVWGAENDPSVGSRETVRPASPEVTFGIEDVTVDGKQVVIEGKEAVVIRCGDASITLTRAGKILIRGNYVLTQSNGVNRILGGSVQVN